MKSEKTEDVSKIGVENYGSLFTSFVLENRLYEAIHPSIFSGLQPWVSLGLLNNHSPLLSVFRG
jgi:hypothetical protein